jgi:hypothetical protein
VEFHHDVEMWPGLALKSVEADKQYKRYLGSDCHEITEMVLVPEPVPGIRINGVMYPMTSILRYS